MHKIALEGGEVDDAQIVFKGGEVVMHCTSRRGRVFDAQHFYGRKF